MRLIIDDEEMPIKVNGKEIAVFELLSIDMFSSSEMETESILKMCQEFFHSLNDLRMQIIVHSRILNFKDIEKHLNLVKANNPSLNRYIEDLSNLVNRNEIPFKQYFLVFSPINDGNWILLNNLRSKLNHIGFGLISIEKKQLINISKALFNE